MYVSYYIHGYVSNGLKETGQKKSERLWSSSLMESKQIELSFCYLFAIIDDLRGVLEPACFEAAARAPQLWPGPFSKVNEVRCVGRAAFR